MLKLTVARVLVAHIARRFIRLATIVAIILLLVAIFISALLAYNFSAWWWLLMAPAVLILPLLVLLRIFMLFVTRSISSVSLRADQENAVKQFVAQLEQIIEARGTPPWLFALITVKDLLIHRDITTIKNLVASTSSLKRNYQKLEKLF
jgi:hypothetical protein